MTDKKDVNPRLNESGSELPEPRMGMPILERLVLALIDGHASDKPREKRFDAAIKAITGKPPVRRVIRQLPDDPQFQALDYMATEYDRDRTSHGRWKTAQALARSQGKPKPELRSVRALAKHAQEKFFPSENPELKDSKIQALREMFTGSYQKKLKNTLDGDVNIQASLLFMASGEDDAALSVMVQTLERIAGELEKYGVPIQSEDIDHLRELKNRDSTL